MPEDVTGFAAALLRSMNFNGPTFIPEFNSISPPAGRLLLLLLPASLWSKTEASLGGGFSAENIHNTRLRLEGNKNTLYASLVFVSGGWRRKPPLTFASSLALNRFFALFSLLFCPLSRGGVGGEIFLYYRRARADFYGCGVRWFGVGVERVCVLLS